MAPANEQAVAARPSTAKEKLPADVEVVGVVGEGAIPTTPVIQPAQGQHPWLRFGKIIRATIRRFANGSTSSKNAAVRMMLSFSGSLRPNDRVSLDTDTISLLQEQHPNVVRRVTETPIEMLAISVITVEEQLSGWYTYLRQARTARQPAVAYEHLAKVVSFLGGHAIVSLSESAISRVKELGKLKLGVRAMDLRIAAIALEINAAVVTRNLRDFRLVPGLRCEDWNA